MSVQYYKRYRMELDLQRARAAFARRCSTSKSVRLPAGYRFVPWQSGDVDVHADVKFRSFRWELDSTVFPCLGDPLGCQQLMTDIAHREGFLPEATWLIAYQARPTSLSQATSIEFCGTIQGIQTDSFNGGIQNVGVTPDHRGQGLGASLVRASIGGFVNRGLDRVQLEVTARNKDAVRLYQRLGFRTVKTVYKAIEVAYT